MDPAENARKKGVSSYDPPIQSRMGGSVTATPPFLLSLFVCVRDGDGF